MPVHDQVPRSAQPTKQRFMRIFRLLALLSAVIAAVAVVLVSRGDPQLHINMLVATALGVFLTVLLGTSLMTLAFLSSGSGHDDAAGGGRKDKE